MNRAFGMAAIFLAAAAGTAKASVLLGTLSHGFGQPEFQGNRARLSYEGGFFFDAPGVSFPMSSPVTFVIPISGPDPVVARLTDGVEQSLYLDLETGSGVGQQIGQPENGTPGGVGWHLGTPDLHGNTIDFMRVTLSPAGGGALVDWEIWGTPNVPAPAACAPLLAGLLLASRRRR
jgi:hypothetical protein